LVVSQHLLVSTLHQHVGFRSLYDLLQENARLEQKVSKAQTVEIRSGGRLCAKGNMKDGKYYNSEHEEESKWVVKLGKQMDNMPLEQIHNLEIYLGGILVARSSSHKTVSRSYNQASNTELLLIKMKDVADMVVVSVGPFTSFEHYCQTGLSLGPPLLGEDPPPGIKVALHAVRFRLENVQGLLDNLGVPPRSASDLAATAQKLLASVSTGQLPDDVAEHRRHRATVIISWNSQGKQNITKRTRQESSCYLYEN